MAFGNHVRVDVRYFSSGMQDFYTSRLWYRNDGSGLDPTNIQGYANDIHEFLQVEVAGVLPASCSFAGVACRFTVGPDEHFAWSNSPVVAGTVSSTEPLPEEDCVIIRRYTGDNARNRHGRIFVPFVPESFQDKGRINATGIIAYSALAVAIRTAPTGDTLDADTVTLTPMQPDYKGNVLQFISTTAVVADVHNRRDRRAPKKPYVVGA